MGFCTQGEILYKGRNLLEMKPEERAWEGIFLSFQYPVEIPGVSMVNFMRTAVNAQREYRGLPALTATEFLRLMREKRAVVQLDNKLANRSVNEGFSGGEKKRNENQWLRRHSGRRPHRDLHRDRNQGQALSSLRSSLVQFVAMPSRPLLTPQSYGS